MADLIDRGKAIQSLYGITMSAEGTIPLKAAVFAIHHTPSAERRGRWICRKADSGFHTDHICSECSTKHAIGWNYCPNCGAKMEDEA